MTFLISLKKLDFDDKLKKFTSNKNKLNELSTKVKVISTKGVTNDLIDKISTLKEVKYFSLGIFQNYLVFIPAIKHIKLNIFIALLKSIHGNLMECQKKVLKI